MKKLFISVLGLVGILVPAVASAQVPDFTYTDRWIIQILSLSQKAVTFLMVLATIFFIYSVIRFIMDKGDDAKATGAKKGAMFRGIIGLAVIVGIWGIVRIITTTLGVSVNTTAPAPCPPGMAYDTINKVCR